MPRPQLPPDFHEVRKTGFGGSDAHHYANIEPYGCARRVVYDKMGVPADYPFTGNNHTERGIWLEPIVAELTTEATG